MNDVSISREERAEKLQGMGCRRKRVEDIRFTQGKGQYVDDIKLPGMLFGDFVRSPYAHARFRRIDQIAPALAAARRCRLLSRTDRGSGQRRVLGPAGNLYF
jgi:carbon-monoxide dehydrogenase large subunit